MLTLFNTIAFLEIIRYNLYWVICMKYSTKIALRALFSAMYIVLMFVGGLLSALNYAVPLCSAWLLIAAADLRQKNGVHNLCRRFNSINVSCNQQGMCADVRAQFRLLSAD